MSPKQNFPHPSPAVYSTYIHIHVYRLLHQQIPFVSVVLMSIYSAIMIIITTIPCPITHRTQHYNTFENIFRREQGKATIYAKSLTKSNTKSSIYLIVPNHLKLQRVFNCININLVQEISILPLTHWSLCNLALSHRYYVDFSARQCYIVPNDSGFKLTKHPLTYSIHRPATRPR